MLPARAIIQSIQKNESGKGFHSKEEFSMAEKIDKSSPWCTATTMSRSSRSTTWRPGERTVLQEFDYLIEAPNWSPDGKFLTFNSNGRIFKFDLETKESREGFHGFRHKLQQRPCPLAGGRPHRGEPRHEGGRKIAHLHGAADGRRAAPDHAACAELPAWLVAGRQNARLLRRGAAGSSTSIRFRVDGGEEKRLTDAPGLNDGPEYDSAGEYIWFNSGAHRPECRPGA